MLETAGWILEKCWRNAAATPLYLESSDSSGKHGKNMQQSHFQTLTGWWFGTWILFFHSVGNNIPNWLLTFIFFRGVGQPPTSNPLSTTQLASWLSHRSAGWWFLDESTSTTDPYSLLTGSVVWYKFFVLQCFWGQFEVYNLYILI